jgi:hypothetical protein
MTRRRSFIIDNTQGKVFYNTTNSISFTADLVAASVAVKSQPIFVKPPGYSVSTVNAIYGWTATGNTVLTTIKMDCISTNPAVIPNSTVGPTGQNLVIGMRKISSTGTYTSLGSFNIPAGSYTSNTTVNYYINTGDSIYIDVTQVGSGNPGQGLKVTLYYYGDTL